MGQVAKDEVRAIRDDNSLNAEQRANALRAIQEETRASIRQLIGDEGLNAYTTQRGGRWVNDLAPKDN